MKLIWNIFNFAFLLIIVNLLTSLICATPVDGVAKRCRREVHDCPADCKATVDSNGCHDCQCGVPYYRAPRRYCPKTKCPPDCGLKKNAIGCPNCYCDLNSYYRRPIDILKYRPTGKQPLAKAAEAKRREKFHQSIANAIIH